MHPSAQDNFKKFIEKYINTSAQTEFIFLEVGSLDVNGSLREVVDKYCTKKVKYIGLDIEAGKGVDEVMLPYHIPYKDYADVVISCNQMEHDAQFWRTLEQMKKAVKPSFLIYICAPSTGHYHAFPVDVYRFYADAFKELAKVYNLNCLENYIDEPSYWKDNIAILQRKANG